MKKFLSSVALSLIISASCRAASHDISGCYDTHLGSWSPQIAEDSIPLWWEVPSRIVLDSTREIVGDEDPTLGATNLPLRTAPGALPSVHASAGWRRIEDGIRVGWSTGFTGINAEMRRSGQDFFGSARTWTDDGGATEYSADLEFHSTACDAPLERTLEDQRPLPSWVRLANGLRIQIGMPLPDSMGWEPGELEGSFGRDDIRMIGPGRVESVSVWVSTRGLVNSVSVEYSDGDAHSRVKSWLDRYLGIPDSHGDHVMPETGEFNEFRLTISEWENREIAWSLNNGSYPGADSDLWLTLRSQRSPFGEPVVRDRRYDGG